MGVQGEANDLRLKDQTKKDTKGAVNACASPCPDLASIHTVHPLVHTSIASVAYMSPSALAHWIAQKMPFIFRIEGLDAWRSNKVWMRPMWRCEYKARALTSMSLH